MATTSVTITGLTEDGKTLEKLNELIAARERYLQNETTRDATIATVINILTSLRAQTRVANPKRAGGVIVAKAGGVTAGWRVVGKGKDAKRTRCLRAGGAVLPQKFVNVAGPWHKGEVVDAYLVHDFADLEALGQKSVTFRARYYIIARSLDDARAEAAKRHERRVKNFAGMAKWTLGMAQAMVSDRPMTGEGVAGAAASVGGKNVMVGKGGGPGSFSVEVRDLLNYASTALKGGEADLQLAIQKAANRTAGIINHLAGVSLDEPIPTPFPEIAK